MPENISADVSEQLASMPLPSGAPGRAVDTRILNSAKLPFQISLASVGFIFLIFVLETVFSLHIVNLASDSDGALTRFIMTNSIYLAFFVVAIFSAFIGYRLTVAAGATNIPVIPGQDYELLAPLVMAGKAESIDQYVRLSSLGRFTGTFTQLGLTGLPLATIFLTLFFPG